MYNVPSLELRRQVFTAQFQVAIEEIFPNADMKDIEHLVKLFMTKKTDPVEIFKQQAALVAAMKPLHQSMSGVTQEEFKHKIETVIGTTVTTILQENERLLNEVTQEYQRREVGFIEKMIALKRRIAHNDNTMLVSGMSERLALRGETIELRAQLTDTQNKYEAEKADYLRTITDIRNALLRTEG